MSLVWRNINLSALWRRIQPWVLGAAGLAALAGLNYYLASTGPRRVGAPVVVDRQVNDAQVIALERAVAELEKKHRDGLALQTAEALSGTWLAQAVAKQRERVRLSPVDVAAQSARLAKLETELADLRAVTKTEQLRQLQREGEEARDAANLPEAAVKLRAALVLQHEINASEASARFKNYGRETLLQQSSAALEAQPLHEQVQSGIASARKAVEEQRWLEALRAFKEARTLQQRINLEFGRTRYADLALVDRLEGEIASLQAADAVAAVNAREQAAEKALQDGRLSEAGQFFGEARDQQRALNEKYPRSRLVSSERVERLEVRRQTAFSQEVAARLIEQERELAERLKRREVLAAELLVTEALARLDGMFATYPKSERLDGALRIKLAFLKSRLGNLRQLQDAVYDHLLPIPGHLELLMLKTEVPQLLYLLLQGNNPSRNIAEQFPVDSVSWEDAQEFCLRLSWVLGRKVRLPAREEFDLVMARGQVGAWSRENSEGHSHEIGTLLGNTAGFFDLLGNLSEWLAVGDGGTTAPVAGGSYLDPADILLTIPVEARNRSDRARHVGFRIIVEMDKKE